MHRGVDSMAEDSLLGILAYQLDQNASSGSKVTVYHFVMLPQEYLQH